MDQKLSELLKTYTGYSQLNEQADVERGRTAGGELGQAAYPERVLEAEEGKLRALGDADKSMIQVKMAEALAELKETLSRKTEQLARGVMEAQSAIQRDTTARIDALNIDRGEGSPRYEQLRDARREAQEAYNEVYVAVRRRPLRTRIVHLYLPILGGFTLLESPLNALAFATFFETDYWITLALAFLIASLLMFFAHLTGLSVLHVLNDRQLKTRIVYLVVGLGLSALGIFLIYTVSELRELYLQVKEVAEGNFDISTIVHSVGPAVDIADLFASVLDFKLDGVGLILATFNLAIFLSGIMLSAIRHDPHRDYESVSRRLAAADNDFVRYRQSAATEIAVLREQANEQLARLDGTSELETGGTEDLRSKIAQLMAMQTHFLGVVDGVVGRRTMAFRQGFYTSLPPPTLEGPTR